MLTPNSRGNYHFLRGGAPYSSAVLADPGYAIVHVSLLNPLPVAKGFDFIAAHLKEQGRPSQAACAIQLRSPRAYSPQEFGEFNTQTYRPALEKHDLLVDGVSPMTRSNLAVEINPPSEPVLYGFGYTVPAEGTRSPRDFVLAGAGENGPDNKIVRAGETSDDAMREKAAFVMRELGERLKVVNATWADCTALNVYTAWNVFPYLRDVLLEPIGRAQMNGLRWYLMRPPIVGLEFEADARRALREIYIP